MAAISINNSTITGLHITRKSSHCDVELKVVADESFALDPNCMQVVCPKLENISPQLHDEIVWPKNPLNKRPYDILQSHVAGKKIGNVPANLCGLFKELLMSGQSNGIKCFPTGDKPRKSRLVPSKQSFRKVPYGKDQRGGGVALDCRYILQPHGQHRKKVITALNNFLSDHDGDESIDEEGEVEPNEEFEKMMREAFPNYKK